MKHGTKPSDKSAKCCYLRQKPTDQVVAIPPESPKTPVGAFSAPSLAQCSQAIRKTLAGDSDGFCEGYEALCSTSTTDRPAETLAKLAAALPDVEAKRYRLKVSVVPLDD